MSKDSHSQYSHQEILRLLDELPAKLEELLKRCVGKEPYFVPDYFTFEQEANELVRPFLEYADRIFHSTGNLSAIASAAMQVFSAKKADYETRLRSIKESSDEKENEIAMDIVMRFKLLFHFFGYSEGSYPGNMLQLFDLDYQLENEKDHEKRQEILRSLDKIMESSSTGLYFRAILALEEGEHEDALKLCNQAIQKFPGNTPVYKLKADILQAMAAKAINEGLKQEPRDQTLRFAKDIEKQVWQLRSRYAKGIIDANVLVRNLEHLIEETIFKEKIDLQKYEEQVRKLLQPSAVLESKTFALLCTGEFLFENLFEPLDFAPSAIEFCKAVENEMHTRVFDPFKTWCKKNNQKTARPTKEDRDYFLYRFVEGRQEITLGAMAMIFQFISSERELEASTLFQKLAEYISFLPNPNMLVNGNGIKTLLTPEAVNKFRNSSAHLETFGREKAKNAKSWCYKLINLLVEATTSTS